MKSLHLKKIDTIKASDGKYNARRAIMNEKAENNIRKMEESFGTYSSRSNVNDEITVTAQSEDDKKNPMADDLKLDYEQPSTNDAMQQPANEKVSTEQAAFSKKTLEDEKDRIKNNFKAFEEEVKEEVKKECPVKDTIENIQKTCEEDPVKGAVEVAKVGLMAIGALAIVKAIIKKL